MELIISEKPSTALKIATFLKRNSIQYFFEKKYKLRYYIVDDTKLITSVTGHINTREYSAEDNVWKDVDALKIINCKIIKKIKTSWLYFISTQIKEKEIDLGIFTDYDSEGELIGQDIVDEIKKYKNLNVINRYLTSAITFKNINEAYLNPVKINNSLVYATELRHNLDLIYGSSLTRFFSMCFSKKFFRLISIGRVQTPVLFTIYKRALEIKNFKPTIFYNIVVLINFKKIKLSFKSENLKEKPDLPLIESILFKKEVIRKTILPPVPLNITTLLSLCTIRDVNKIMQICEKLYLDGYITYPRTDSQYISSNFNISFVFNEILTDKIKDRINKINQLNLNYFYRKGNIDAAHVAIIPLKKIDEQKFEKDTIYVYNLIVDRFLNCFEQTTIYEDVTLYFQHNNLKYTHTLKLKIEQGWNLKIKYNKLPNLEQYIIEKIEVEENVTKPISKYTQNSLIKVMEKDKLGTKSTRHTYFKKLSDRRFIDFKLNITKTGYILCSILELYLSFFRTAEFTKQMELDLELIQNGTNDAFSILKKYKQILEVEIKKLQFKEEEIYEQYLNLNNE